MVPIDVIELPESLRPRSSSGNEKVPARACGALRRDSVYLAIFVSTVFWANEQGTRRKIY